MKIQTFSEDDTTDSYYDKLVEESDFQTVEVSKSAPISIEEDFKVEELANASDDNSS